ncbi:Zn(2)-C6 fungal-type domain-containing protein [Fusarium sp. Ph1]|nr:Zn(2)-C6 fungal-type domain-containing protein [Fusarium sp. Ph1]
MSKRLRPPPGSRSGSRSLKKRTGCEQCKRRKVKCDEQQPSCSRCVARGEVCTGNFHFDTWQIERPWITATNSSTPGPALEDDTLRYWYNTACLIMAMFPPPTNPLSYPLARYLQRSRALRHAIQSVSSAHRHGFSSNGLSYALNQRNLAIVSLQGEITRIQSASSNRQTLLRTLTLSSLILCVSSSWLDHSGRDYGGEFLMGVRRVMPLILDGEPTDAFAFYILGLFLYCECFSSYLVPASQQLPADEAVLRAAGRAPFSTTVHPVTGVATTLCPILIEIGYYYRRVVEGQGRSSDHERHLRRQLLDWEPPTGSPDEPRLLQLAEGYRDIGDIMLYQAQRISTPIDPVDASILMEKVLGIMDTIKNLPQNDTVINWMGPLLLIAGSELPAAFTQQRLLVKRSGSHLVSVSRIPVYATSAGLIEQIWSLRDQGEQVSWLEVMVGRGLALGLG